MMAPTLWLSCGVLRAELEELLRRGAIHGELRFLDSMLHMDPGQLQATLQRTLGQSGPEGGRLVWSMATAAARCWTWCASTAWAASMRSTAHRCWWAARATAN